MKRLSFELKEWTRLIWTTNTSGNDLWKSRMQKITSMWTEMEKLTVLNGIRSAAMVFVFPENLLPLTQWAAKNDLLALPVQQVSANTENGYAAESITYERGKLFQYRVIITKKEHSDQAYACYARSDEQAIGELLGFPNCCSKFFQEYWVDQKYKDVSWPMAVNTIGSIPDDVYEIDITNGHPNCNILWHWMGVRLTMHLPCSFTCNPTINLVNDIIQCGHDAGFVEELKWTQEILSWPIEWSALHGIAEIKTPLFKVSTRTDATADRYIIRYHSDKYPDEGATGVVFPYKKADVNPVTEGKAFKRAFDVPLPPRIADAPNMLPDSDLTKSKPPSSEANKWIHNGFTSKKAMEDAHDVLLKILEKNFEWTGCCGTVLDLGCGNGVLLDKICSKYKGLTPHGVEIEKDRFFSAYTHLSDTGEIANGSISDLALWPEENYDLVVLMPRRIEELDKQSGDAVRDRLHRVARTFLLYGYGDDISAAGGLDKLNECLGLPSDLWSFSEVIQTDEASAVLVVRTKT